MDPLYFEALAALETAGGRKTIKGPNGEDSNNLYNIKDFSGKGYSVKLPGADSTQNTFRVYGSKQESTSDLTGLLSRMYPKALEANSPEEFARSLQGEGGKGHKYAPNDPGYVAKFVGTYNRLAGQDTGPRQDVPVDVPGLEVHPQRTLEDLMAAAATPRPPAALKMTHTAKAIDQLASVRSNPRVDEGAWFTKATQQETVAVQAEQDAKNQSFLDILRSSEHQQIEADIVKRLVHPEYPADGFVPTNDDLAGYSTDEIAALKQATSKAEFEHIKFDINDYKTQLDNAGKSGLMWQLAGGLVTGLPSARLSGGLTEFAVANTILKGARAAGAAGAAVSTSRKLAASVASNVGGNLAMTAAQDAMSPFIGAQDYVMGMALGGIVSSLHAPRIFGASRAAEVRGFQDLHDVALREKQVEVEAAAKTAGPGATPEEIAALATTKQADTLRGELQSHTDALPAERQIIPAEINAELEGDVPKVDAPNRMELPTLSDGTTAATDIGVPAEWTNFPHNGQGILSEQALARGLDDVGHATADNLGAAWTRSNPHGAKAIADFESGYGLSYSKVVANVPDRAVTFIKSGGLDDNIKKAAEWIHKTFLPDLRVVVMDMAETPTGRNPKHVNVLGDAWDIGRDISVIRVSSKGERPMYTLVHEFGHIIFNRHIHSVAEATKDGFMAVYAAWRGRYTGANRQRPAQGMSSATDTAMRRGGIASEPVLKTLSATAPEGFIPSMMDIMSNTFHRLNGELRKVSPEDIRAGTDYIPSVKEFSAEQFVKHLEAAVADELHWKPASLPQGVRDFFTGMWDKWASLFNKAKAAKLIAPEEGVVKFFEEIRTGYKSAATRAERINKGLPEYGMRHEGGPIDGPSQMAQAPRTDAEIQREHGIDRLAGSTTAQSAEVKAVTAIWRKAENTPLPDQARMGRLLRTAPMKWAASTSLRLLNSENPVARMVAAELLENGGGAAGRRSTAAMAKHIFEGKFLGNTINDFDSHYVSWRNANGGGLREDHFGGKVRERFDRLVTEEIEGRLQGRDSNMPAAVRGAADALESAYERMRTTQQEMKTPGWAALPPSSYGYMPHRMSAEKVRAATPDQLRVVHGVLAQQFEGLEGFDKAFSGKLASKYLDIIHRRATAGYAAQIGVHNTEAADIVEQSAKAMGMSRDEANALAKRVLKAAPSHTKHRLKLDLTQTFEADGKQFQLLDLFETDHMALLKSQVGRVSGEAALVRHGIMGSTGLNILRRAMSDFGAPGMKADNDALEAFDQVAAEMLGRPFGTKTGPWLDRAMQANSLMSLGGMGFNQAAETLNAAVTLGVRHALASVGSFGRLRAEILALAKGQQVNNPIIGSLELYGREFGTDAYKVVFPYDSPNKVEATYGTHAVTAGDRLLRTGLALQGKLSLWRAISSAQQRGVAEQIVHKALRYAREGGNDVALADMGIDAAMTASLRKELPTVAKFDPSGRLLQFDITKLEDRATAQAFVEAVHRGAGQIIQGHFIGETGKWAHNDFLKMLTQFRSFSIVAIEKQWNRQVGNHGTAKALGMLLGTMSFAAPIVMIRAGINSVGRPDQDKYLAKMLSPGELARQTLNYVALSGLSGDLLDTFRTVTGNDAAGGRSGQNKSLIGQIAPAAGKVDAIWGALQDNRKGTDIHGVVQQLPFARLPFLIPAVNALKQ